MDYPNTLEAMEIFEQGLVNLKTTRPELTADKVESLRNHALRVANIAKTIAQKANDTNADKAYTLGLLHDYGKFVETENTTNLFHGTIGYEYFNKIGYYAVAKASLTHSFVSKDIDVDAYDPYPKTELLKCCELLKAIEYDDYDKLIQLSDHLGVGIKHSTLKNWMIYLKNENNYPLSMIRRKYKDILSIKRYFDKKCGCDIYKLLEIF